MRTVFRRIALTKPAYEPGQRRLTSSVAWSQAALSGTPREVFPQVDTLRELHLDVPHMTALADSLRRDGMPLPGNILTVDEMTKEVLTLLCPSK